MTTNQWQWWWRVWHRLINWTVQPDPDPKFSYMDRLDGLSK